MNPIEVKSQPIVNASADSSRKLVQFIKKPALAKFVAAVERGTQYLVNHPKASWKLFIKGRKQLDDELNRRAWRDTLPRFALRPGALDEARYTRFAEFLKNHGLIKAPPPVETYAVEIE